jgi:hypothetical protein
MRGVDLTVPLLLWACAGQDRWDRGEGKQCHRREMAEQSLLLAEDIVVNIHWQLERIRVGAPGPLVGIVLDTVERT